MAQPIVDESVNKRLRFTFPGLKNFRIGRADGHVPHIVVAGDAASAPRYPIRLHQTTYYEARQTNRNDGHIDQPGLYMQLFFKNKLMGV